MLLLTLHKEAINYENGIAVGRGPTRYDGEYWDRIAADLVCGTADVFPDVGIVLTGKLWDADPKLVLNANDWAALTSQDHTHKSLWHLSEEYGWMFVPSCREHVEQVMTWSMPYLRDNAATEGSRSIVFPGYRQFRERLDFENWSRRDEGLHSYVKDYCSDRALFEMTWSWGSWTLYPRSIERNHLLKLTDPVAARINAVYGD